MLGCISALALAFCCQLQADSIDGLRSAAEQEGAGPEKWVSLGDALMQEARNTLDHDFSAAQSAYLKALKLDDHYVDAIAGMAWVKNSEHQFKAGEEWAKKALDHDPKCLQAYALLGDGAMELGEYDAAFDHIQSALDIRADLSTMSRAAHLLWLTGETTRAQALMGQAIRAGGPVPENEAWCRAELALMQFRSGAMQGAIKQAEEAVKLAPENPRVLYILARIRAAQGRLNDAIELNEKSVLVTPTHESMAELVSLYEAAGEPEKAKKQVSKVLSFHKAHHHGGNGKIHTHGHGSGGNFQLALFMAEQGLDPSAALAEAKRAYSAYPNLRAADAYAWCAHKAGDSKLAERMIRRAIEWNTADPDFYFHAGMIMADAKKSATAQKYLAKALNLNPQFDPIDADVARKELERLQTSTH